MTYADNYNIRTTSVKFNDVADALDGLITRNYAGVTTGTSTAYIATPTPAWDAYTTSGLVVIIPHVTNTGAATLNISGLGARDLRIGNAAIAAGVLQQNIPTIMAYTGTYFEVLLQNISIPIGTIYTYAGASSPTGYLLCDGTAVSRSTYAALFGIIGTTYGAGNTTTTFNLPDLRRRVPIGRGTSDTLGGSDGLAYASRSVSHSHSVPPHFHGMGNVVETGADLNITSSGGGGNTSIESADHFHSGFTGDDSPDHTHSFSKRNNTTTPLTTGTPAASSGTGTDVNFGTTGASTRHQHAFVTGGVSFNHTHTIPNHAHNTASFSGRIGLVTGGVDGNASMTSGVSTQPYLFINYIIKT
jgi:hypothetical protein